MQANNNGHACLISVILPVFNGEAYLAEALESVLAQSLPPDELIVVDDGSSDRTRDIARSFSSVTYLYQPNGGTASARNLGIQSSHGEFLAFLDADDLWMPEKLALQMKAFQEDATLEVVSGMVKQFVSTEVDSETASRYALADRPLPGYSPGAILIKRPAMERLGLFHENYQSAEALSWFVEALEKKPRMRILQEVVLRRRIHGKNVSIIRQKREDQEIMRILKGSIARRRAKGT